MTLYRQSVCCSSLSLFLSALVWAFQRFHSLRYHVKPFVRKRSSGAQAFWRLIRWLVLGHEGVSLTVSASPAARGLGIFLHRPISPAPSSGIAHQAARPNAFFPSRPQPVPLPLGGGGIGPSHAQGTNKPLESWWHPCLVSSCCCSPRLCGPKRRLQSMHSAVRKLALLRAISATARPLDDTVMNPWCPSAALVRGPPYRFP